MVVLRPLNRILTENCPARAAPLAADHKLDNDRSISAIGTYLPSNAIQLNGRSRRRSSNNPAKRDEAGADHAARERSRRAGSLDEPRAPAPASLRRAHREVSVTMPRPIGT